MADTITVKLVTPHRLLFDDKATSVVGPGKNGEFGVLPGHDPWFLGLGMGLLVITSPNGDVKRYFLNGGFCQIDDDNVVILAEVCEPSSEIDVERALAAKKRAEERLKSAGKDETLDYVRAEMAMRRALHRLEINDNK
ncbi:MAG: F0F1 ATP synthase subunit epsilon [Myxococcales bacterium]|nr:F0F1 ATP synthase subunit epsilon [Myxococcales bacterium]